jgi:hypothetical protein
MTEGYRSQEADRDEPKAVCLGPHPSEPGWVSIGKLYDRPGQVFEPEADLSGSGGLRSMDSRHADTSLGAGKPRGASPPESEGCLLIKTEGQTYWVEGGVMIHIEETVRTGDLVAELVEDSEPRIIIGSDSWSYKPSGAVGGLAGWKDAGKILTVAVDALESDNRQTLTEHSARGTFFDGFEDAAMQLASVGVDPEIAVQAVLSTP